MPCGGNDMSRGIAGADHVPGLLGACLPANLLFTTRSTELDSDACHGVFG